MRLEIGFRSNRNKIASIHESTRPHLAKAYEEFRKLKSSYIENAFKQSLESGLRATGEAFVSFYRDYVVSGKVKPPLKESTIKAKIRKRRRYPSTPLVDTGEMINSIYYEVVP